MPATSAVATAHYLHPAFWLPDRLSVAGVYATC
jgi:hypothetical protein